MKQFLKLIVCFSYLLACVACATPVSVKLKVIDEDKKPIAEAEVGMSFLLSHGENSFRGKTNSAGTIEATQVAHFGVSLSARKAGYYSSGLRTGYGDQDITLLLRETKNPVGMYAKKVGLGVGGTRKLGEQFGYDLMVGDFVAPHGKGNVGDILITHSGAKEDMWNYSHKMKINFSNPNDGLIPFYIDQEVRKSKFLSSYLSPSEGYKNEWILYSSREGVGKPIEGNIDRFRNYYFRVRTKLNEKGEIESAHYGKIYGEFSKITYYINPIPNDRNVEFDPNKNIFKNLGNDERVLDP